MNNLAAFAWGCAGSGAHEIVIFCNAVRDSKNCRLPIEYRKPAFVVARILLIAVAGVLAAAWGISQPIQGIALGAATPQIMLRLERLRLGVQTHGD
jgi:hypothetical protein